MRLNSDGWIIVDENEQRVMEKLSTQCSSHWQVALCQWVRGWNGQTACAWQGSFTSFGNAEMSLSAGMVAPTLAVQVASMLRVASSLRWNKCQWSWSSEERIQKVTCRIRNWADQGTARYRLYRVCAILGSTRVPSSTYNKWILFYCPSVVSLSSPLLRCASCLSASLCSAFFRLL